MDIVFHDSVDRYEREYQTVRAAFIADGTTLNEFLVSRGIGRQLAYRALKGRSFGRKSIEVRALLLREAMARRERAANG